MNRVESQPQQQMQFKMLKLISGDLPDANIHLETPTFVSPVRNDRVRCGDCRVAFTPLVYASGRSTSAHHFHEREGGIYFYEEPDRLNNFFNAWIQTYKSGWIAMLENHGEIIKGELPDSRRSPEVLVKGIRAFCTEAYCLNNAESKELTEGLVVEKSNLVPACGDNVHPELENKTRFKFKIDNGHVLFTSA